MTAIQPTNKQIAKLETRFLVADISVALQCQNEQRLAQLSALWQQFFYVKDAALTEPSLTISFDEKRTPAAEGEEIYRTETLYVAKTAQGFFLRCAEAWLELTPAQSKGEGFLPESFWGLNPYDQREFFLLSLLMLLRPHGLYGLHANGLATNEEGLLIVGPSGSGKTTLTLSLLEQGWQFVSDDAVLLKDTASSSEPLHAYAFRRGFSFTSQTETFFDTVQTEAMYSAQDKRVLDAEQLYPEQFTPSLIPRLIIFPEIGDQAESEIATLSASEALIALVQQSAGSMIDRGAAAKQLELLKRLVQSSSCYRVRSGRDVIEQGERVSAKLKTLLGRADGDVADG